MCDLKAKYDDWREWLYGDDIHSICRQIRDMIWDSAVFLSVNESRKYMPLDGEREPMNNGMVHSFINRCFFRTQGSAIRRLLDREVRTGPRSVISLWRLIVDMQQNASLLTRYNIITALGYPYDFQTEHEKILQTMDATPGRPVIPPNYILCRHSEYMHKIIDSMTNIPPDNRSREDTVPESFFEWAKERLDINSKDINTYINKFFAHSASPESRKVANADEINVSYGHILDAHKVICEVTDLLCRCFFNQTHGGYLPTVVYDQFKHFDQPLATKETIQQIRDCWREYHKEIESFSRWDWQSEYKLTRKSGV